MGRENEQEELRDCRDRCDVVVSVENVREVLTLTADGKNGVVSTGELTVFLDGLSFDPQHMHNGNSTTASSKNPDLTSDLQCSGCPPHPSVCLSEVHQNGDALHENADESSARTQNR